MSNTSTQQAQVQVPTYTRFDYYSGSQITIWFGDVMLDDVNSIQWTRSQNKKPIYGYASQQFDAVAKGTVIIQGSFIINFRQAGYMPLLMNRILDIYSSVPDVTKMEHVRSMIGLHLRQGTFGPKTADEIKNIANSNDFLDLAKAYEDAIWGGGIPGDPNSANGGSNTSNITPPTPADVRQHNILPDGFKILITYGNNSSMSNRSVDDYLQSTVKTLNGVHLLGDSQVIQVGGQPVMEQYDFIARGTDEQLSSFR
jgi:hypothetical protein